MQYKNFFKTMLLQVLSFILVVGGFVVYAISFPTEAPETEVNGGALGSIFDISDFSSSGVVVSTGEKLVSTGLTLDVEGKIGAMQYCDKNGEECFDIADFYDKFFTE